VVTVGKSEGHSGCRHATESIPVWSLIAGMTGLLVFSEEREMKERIIKN
jgi:hypothetical protein